MTNDHLEGVEAALLCLSEARERAERAARDLRGAPEHEGLAAVLEDADRRLLALHGELMRAAYFPRTASAEAQLELAPAQSA